MTDRSPAPVAIRARRCALGALAAFAAAPVLALTPPPPCDGVVESGMFVGGIQPLDPETGTSGVTLETYGNAQMLDGTVYVDRPAPLPQLEDVWGSRVTLCTTGEFLVVDGHYPEEVATAMAATEFLRAQVQAGQPVSFGDLRRAAEALYGPVLVLRETDQTCSCNYYFDQSMPAGQTPFEARTDVER